MAVSHQGVYVQTPQCALQNILPADTTTKKTLYTGGSNGSKVTAIMCASTDTTARTVQIWIGRSATNYLWNTLSVPVTAGNDGTTAPVNFFTNVSGAPLDNDGQHYLFLNSGDTLQVASLTTVTAGKEIDFVAVVGDF